MKKIFLSAMLFALVAFNTQAAVLIVKEYGVNATFSSISSAITAAANNDTIVVYDKPSGQAWIESLTIDKNLTFLNAVSGARMKAPGTVTVVPKAGMDLYFIGWNMNSQNLVVTATGATATSTDRAKITVTDCINAVDINLNQDWIDARIFYNQSVAGTVYFRHGMAVANVITGGIYTVPESTTAAENDSIIILGNKAGYCVFDSKEAGLIANNYFFSSATINYSAALHIINHNQNANAILSIVNNSITNAPYSMAAFSCGTTSNIRIVNNLFYSTGTYAIRFTNYTGLPFISHNFINLPSVGTYCNVTFNNELNYTVAGTNLYGPIDTWGRAASGNTQLINKGNYLGEYFDIDLSRNDIGTYGGPYTIDNYINANASKARVLYINIKHQLTNLNQILNVKGSAGSRF